MSKLLYKSRMDDSKFPLNAQRGVVKVKTNLRYVMCQPIQSVKGLKIQSVSGKFPIFMASLTAKWRIKMTWHYLKMATMLLSSVWMKASDPSTEQEGKSVSILEMDTNHQLMLLQISFLAISYTFLL